MNKPFLYFLIVLCACLSNCKSSSNDKRITVADYIFPDFGVTPYEELSVRKLSPSQINIKYGAPRWVEIDTLTFGKNTSYNFDGTHDNTLAIMFADEPTTVIHTYIWVVDSIHELKMFYWEEKKNKLKSVYGYQYSSDPMMLE